MLFVSSSISTKSILAPQCKPHVAEATNVFGTVHKIFFLLRFKAKQDK